jgi:hypothetical protein
MRSTPWTSSVPAECRYELRDGGGGVLAQSESRDEAERMLASYVMTHPGREDDVALHTLSANGKTIVCEDIFDIGFPR